MIRSLPLSRPAAVDLPKASAPADPSVAAAVLAGLPVAMLAGLARRAALNAQVPALAPYPAPKKDT